MSDELRWGRLLAERSRLEAQVAAEREAGGSRWASFAARWTKVTREAVPVTPAGELEDRIADVLALCAPYEGYGGDRERWEREVRARLNRVFGLGRSAGWHEARQEVPDGQV